MAEGSDAPEILAVLLERKLQRASDKGLTARWSREFGFVSLHDPTTGEVHDLKTEDAPTWAKNESFKRKDLYKAGRQDAYELTSAQMNALWEQEHPPSEAEEGIQEAHTDDLD